MTSSLRASIRQNKLCIIAMYANEPSFYHTTENETAEEATQKFITEKRLVPACYDTVLTGIARIDITPNCLIVRLDDVICYRIHLHKVKGFNKRLMAVTTVEGCVYYVEAVDERILAAIDKCSNEAAVHDFFIHPVTSLMINEGVGRQCQS